MSEATHYKVRLEPVGIEMDVEEGETVLDAAFRQGIALMHGCKEGQCGSCKSRLMSGDIELLKYSTFALLMFPLIPLLCRRSPASVERNPGTRFRFEAPPRHGL